MLPELKPSRFRRSGADPGQQAERTWPQIARRKGAAVLLAIKASQAKRGRDKQKGMIEVAGYEVIPEARETVDFDSLWAAFWRCAEYCGARRALHLVLDHLPRLAWDTVFQTLEDEAAGEWAWQEERDDADWPPEEPRGRTRTEISKIDREFAISAIAGARAAMAKLAAEKRSEGAAQ